MELCYDTAIWAWHPLFWIFQWLFANCHSVHKSMMKPRGNCAEPLILRVTPGDKLYWSERRRYGLFDRRVKRMRRGHFDTFYIFLYDKWSMFLSSNKIKKRNGSTSDTFLTYDRFECGDGCDYSKFRVKSVNFQNTVKTYQNHMHILWLIRV